MGTPTPAQVLDENRYLNDELNRVETVLNLTRAEKDELSIRYNALSDRVSLSMMIFCIVKKIRSLNCTFQH
jgi:rootletin